MIVRRHHDCSLFCYSSSNFCLDWKLLLAGSSIERVITPFDRSLFEFETESLTSLFGAIDVVISWTCWFALMQWKQVIIAKQHMTSIIKPTPKDIKKRYQLVNPEIENIFAVLYQPRAASYLVDGVLITRLIQLKAF